LIVSRETKEEMEMNPTSNMDTGILIYFILGNMLFMVVIFVIMVVYVTKMRKLKKNYDAFFNTGYDVKNLEELIHSCLFKTHDVMDQNKEIVKSLNRIEGNMLRCVQKIALIRYNAFDDVGSDQSFSIALMDNSDNGLVISGIYNRQSSAVYAKTVEAGKSKYTLSAEEIQAIDRARKNYGEREYAKYS
jgi:hypothetical protein